METFIGFFVLLALAAVILLIVTSIAIASRIRGVESNIKKLGERVALLEAAQSRVTVAKESQTEPTPPVTRATPPPLPAFVTTPSAAPSSHPATPTPAIPKLERPIIDWEAFMGVKLFAWIGGFVFFLGVVFLVKYSFENNLITPLMRIAVGGVAGLGLLIAGWLATKKNYRIPGQSLCATGVLVLYADVYAAHTFYYLISILTASILMCAVTAGALFLATRLEAQSVVWLAALGGFLTPALLWMRQDNPLALFGYVALLNLGMAAVATLKRWNYFILIAAIGTVAMEAAWAADFFGVTSADIARRILLLLEAEFLLICIARQRIRAGENWSALATALLAFAALIFCIAASDNQEKYSADFTYPVLLLANAGLVAVAVARRARANADHVAGAIIAIGLFLTWIAEWAWHETTFESSQPILGIVWYATVFLLFAAVPAFCGTKPFWPWLIAALAGPLQFWFVYQLLEFRFPNQWIFLLPLAFAIPAAAGLFYLLGQEKVGFASSDARLATQIIAFLFFISLIFPVQFEREWITLGWAIEGVALLLLYRRFPNRHLQIVSVVVLSAAFVRLAFNPAVLEYHPRSAVKIWNWYLYAYGLTSACLLIAAWLVESKHQSERFIRSFLYSLGVILLFLLLNIEIADYFSIGPTLTFSFSGNFARDMTYSIAWALFAFALLLIGMNRKSGAARYAALCLLFITLAKLFMHDLGSLSQLYRIGAFIGVALILIVASFLYQRFLRSTAKSN